MRILALLSSLCVLCGGVSIAGSEPPRVIVSLVLLREPSTIETAVDLGSLGESFTDPAQLLPAGVVYLEAWCQTIEPSGLSTAVLDVTYETALFDTSMPQITIGAQWMDVFEVTRFVDDVSGLVKDIGGVSFSGLGIAPNWVKMGTVAFDVVDVPNSGVTFCSRFGGDGRAFGILGVGSVLESEVDYQCLTIGTTPGDCNGDSQVDLTDYGTFNVCMTGPDSELSPSCDCADLDQDGDVDLADFWRIQNF